MSAEKAEIVASRAVRFQAGKCFGLVAPYKFTVAMPLSTVSRTARRARNLVGTQAVELDDRSLNHTSAVTSRQISEL